jgi:hypothetical protein
VLVLVTQLQLSLHPSVEPVRSNTGGEQREHAATDLAVRMVASAAPEVRLTHVRGQLFCAEEAPAFLAVRAVTARVAVAPAVDDWFSGGAHGPPGMRIVATATKSPKANGMLLASRSRRT